MATGITLATGFQVNAQLPADLKINVADIAARDALPGITRFKGMIVTVQDSDGSGTLATYILTAQSGTTINNADWATFGAGGIVTADNGLSTSGSTVELGGNDLLHDTQITNPSSYNFQILGPDTLGCVLDMESSIFNLQYNTDPTYYSLISIGDQNITFQFNSVGTAYPWIVTPTTLKSDVLVNTDPTAFVQADSSGFLSNVSLGSIGVVVAADSGVSIDPFNPGTVILGGSDLTDNREIGVPLGFNLAVVDAVGASTFNYLSLQQDGSELGSESADFQILGSVTDGIPVELKFVDRGSPSNNLLDVTTTTIGSSILTNSDANKFLQADSSGNISNVTIPTGSGTVTSFTFTDGHGFDGTVTNSTTTPTLSLTTQLTPGSVPFISSPHDLAEDNNALFWDNTNKYLGINTGATPTHNFQVSTSGSTTASSSQINSYANVTGTTGANGVVINSKVNTTADMSVQTRGLAVSQNVVANGFNLTNTPGQEAILATSNLTDSGHVVTLSGVVAKATNSSSGTVDYGVGLRLLPNLNSGGGTLTTSVGAEIDDQTHGTNNTNLLLGVPDANTAPTGNFSIYNVSAYTNYFAGNLGIGTTAPVAALNAVATSAADFRGIVSDEYINAGNSAHFQARKARGTLTSPTTVSTGDGIGSFLSYGYDGTSYLPVGRIDVLATGTVSTGIIPGIMRFRTADATGTLTTAGSFGADQALTLSSIPALGSPATLFLVSNSGTISSRTPSQVRSDIGAGTGSGTVTGSSTATYITFWDTSTDISGDSNMIWDNTNKWVGLNTSATGPTNTITMGQGANGIASYNTTDQVTNFEKYVSQWQSSTYSIGTYIGGSGTTVRSLQIGVQTSNVTTTGFNRKLTFNGNTATTAGIYDFNTSTSGANSIMTMQGQLSASSGNQKWLAIQPTINQTSTAGYTALYISPQTSGTGAGLGSGTQFLIDAGTSAAVSGATHTTTFAVNQLGFTGIGGAPSAELHIQGAVSAPVWSTSGIGIRQDAATYTDTTTGASGTVTTSGINALAVPVIAATNATVTYTNPSTLYIAGAPTAGTNVTLTNKYALHVATGTSVFQGGLSTNTGGSASPSTGAIFSAIGGNGSSQISSSAAGNVFAGATTVQFAGGFIPSSTTGTLGANNSYTKMLISSSGIAAAGTGTHSLLANMVINPIGTITGAATITNTASLYIGGATTGGTNNYALWTANGGAIRFDLGSDATGDIYYRNSSGAFTRLAIGSSTNVLTVTGGVPVWSAASTGTVTSITAGTGIALSPSTITTTGSVTNTLTTGLAGGQTIYGDTASGGNLNIYATTNPVQGLIYLGSQTEVGGSLRVDNQLYSNGIQEPYVAITTTYSAQASDYEMDCISGTFTVTLPDATTGNFGQIYVVTNSGAGTITVTTAGGTQQVGNASGGTFQLVTSAVSRTFHSSGGARGWTLNS